MKSYFDFTLKGKDFLPYWIAYYLVAIIPSVILGQKMDQIDPVDYTSPAVGAWLGTVILIYLLVIFASIIITLYMVKISVEGVTYEGENMKFDLKIGKFIGLIVKGYLLSIITIGIYLPWFIKEVYAFFMAHSSYKSENLHFQSKGSTLFIIMLLFLIIPLLVISALASWALVGGTGESSFIRFWAYEMVLILIITPFLYRYYKWLVNVQYKGYQINWDTEFWPSVTVLLREVFLSMITFGIYHPLAIVKIYKYFVDRTKSDNLKRKQLTFGYDIEPADDFLFIWGQILLSIITLGIYVPWAYAKVGKRILGKTYMEKEVIR